MKKIFTLFAVAAMAMSAAAQDEKAPLWIGWTGYSDATTTPVTVDLYSGTEVTDPNGITFENGVTMWLVKDQKTYSGGVKNNDYGQPLKLSNGAPNAVILPEGFATQKIIFYGYCNDKTETNTAWIANISAEVNGALETVFEGSSENFLKNMYSKENNAIWAAMTLDEMPKIECNLTKPVSGTMWFKNGGKQPCVFMEIYPSDSAAVNGVEVNADAPVEYFNAQGVRVANPSNGLYIRRQGGVATKVVIK